MWSELFKQENSISDFSVESKIKILELSEQRVNYLKNNRVKELQLLPDEREKIPFEQRVINTDYIIGLARPVFGDISWLDVLDRYCHHTRNFEIYNKDTFESFLVKQNIDEPMTVIEDDGNYYIDGNGLHRLTIAKCLGNKIAMVYARTIRKNKIIDLNNCEQLEGIGE